MPAHKAAINKTNAEKYPVLPESLETFGKLNYDSCCFSKHSQITANVFIVIHEEKVAKHLIFNELFS